MKTEKKNPTIDDFITTQDAAKILNVTYRHVTVLLRDNVLDGRKLGTRWLVLRDSVYKYLESRDR